MFDVSIIQFTKAIIKSFVWLYEVRIIIFVDSSNSKGFCACTLYSILIEYQSVYKWIGLFTLNHYFAAKYQFTTNTTSKLEFVA